MSGLPRLQYTTFLQDFITGSSLYCALSVFEYAIVCKLLNIEHNTDEKYEVLKRISGELKLAKAKARRKKSSDLSGLQSGFSADQNERAVVSNTSQDGDLTAETAEKGKRRTSLADLLDQFSTLPEHELKHLTSQDQKILQRLILYFGAPSSPFCFHPFNLPTFPFRYPCRVPSLTPCSITSLDPNNDNKLDAGEVRAACRRFGVYLSRDSVLDTFERHRMSLDGVSHLQFLELVQLQAFEHQHYLDRSFWDQPGSLQVDMFFRVFYIPVFLVVVFVYWIIVLPSNIYSDGDVVFKFPDSSS